MINFFSCATCLLYIIGEVHCFGLFNKLPDSGLPVVFTRPQATPEVDKVAHLSAAKGGLEQKVDFTVIYSKRYYTGTHLLSPYAIATADCLLKMDHSFVEIWS